MNTLWPHQKETFELYQRSNVVLDLSDAGTGKTLAALEAFRQRRRNGGGRALVVAPKTLLAPAWAAEIRKFCPELTFSIAYASNRLKAFQVAADVYITNTDAVRWLLEQPARFFKTFDTLIVDEISDFKHENSLRSKALAKLSGNFRYRAGLTATPTANSITDLWHQAYLMDGGHRLGQSFYHFRNTVQEQKPNPKHPRFMIWEDKPHAMDAVYALIKDITIRHEFAVVMPHVPDNTEYTVEFTPSAKLLKVYERMRKEALAIAESGELINAVNAAALRTKLLQIASGAVYGETGEPVTLDTERSDLVADLVAQRPHSVVFYLWKHQRDQLAKSLKKLKLPFAIIDSDTKDRDRDRIVQEFQAGKYRAILMHPKTGSHGLTLTRGTSVIWCSPPDRADWLVQGKHRVYRGVQDKETEAIMVCAKHTLEARVYANTGGKRFNMQRLLDLIKEN